MTATNNHLRVVVTNSDPDSCSLADYSLVELLRAVAEHGSRAAMAEFHNHRKPFVDKRGMYVRFGEYVHGLHQSYRERRAPNMDPLVLDRAYDLTLDKFCQLPTEDEAFSGVDARYYFKAALGRIERRLAGSAAVDAVRQELDAARCLQAFVIWHFEKSVQEMKRRSRRLYCRHVWQHDCRRVTLWRPLHLTKGELDEWLAACVAGGTPLLQASLQDAIDQHFGRCRETHQNVEWLAQRAAEDVRCYLPANLEEAIARRGLAAIVADEKAASCNQQRPAIRALGPAALRQLVLRVFDNLPGAANAVSDRVVAREFDLSPSTFSRFAGTQWLRRADRIHVDQLPDLYLNLARVCAQHRPLAEVVQEQNADFFSPSYGANKGNA